MTLLDEIHRYWLQYCLSLKKGNKVHAARYLGISIRTFRNWEIKFGLRPKEFPRGRCLNKRSRSVRIKGKNHG